MANEDSTEFKKCIVCGRYCPEASMIVGHYCSEACASQYRRCACCGDYFMLVDGSDQIFCSSDCQNADKIQSGDL